MIAQYSDKDQSYFEHANLLIASGISGDKLHVLDVGCGRGALLRILRERGVIEKSYGVELVPEAAAAARPFATQVWNESIEGFTPPLEAGTLDYVICADVLEHLRDPASALINLRALLKPGGHILISLPNASNRRLLWDLAMKNEWRYASSGIMDATHLRWFTRKSAVRMLEEAGFVVLDFDYVFWGKGGAVIHHLSFGCLSRFVASQLFFVATPTQV